MSDVKKGIGERLKSAREKKNLKQNRVALYLGVHNSTLAKYESGEREADNETLIKLADYYEVNADWILSGDASTTKDYAKSSFLESFEKLSPENQKLVENMVKALKDQQ